MTALTVDITVELGYEPSILGLVLAAYGVGTVVGSLLSARWIGRSRVAQVLIGGNVTMGLALIVLSLSVQIPVLLGVAFVAGVAQSLVLVMYLTLRTTYSPDALLGRIGSTARTFSWACNRSGCWSVARSSTRPAERRRSRPWARRSC